MRPAALLRLLASVAALSSPAYAAPAVPLAHETRTLRYDPSGIDFELTPGSAYFSFNRPLYGTHSAFRIDAGDRPEYLLFLPGRGGNLRLGVERGGEAIWLVDANYIRPAYRAGSMLHQVGDRRVLGTGSLHIQALPLADTEGLVLSILPIGVEPGAKLIWAFGGASGYRGNRNLDLGTEKPHISDALQYRPEDGIRDTFEVGGPVAFLESSTGRVALLPPQGASLRLAPGALWNNAQALAAARPETSGPNVLVGSVPLGSEPVHLALQRVTRTEKARQIFDRTSAENARFPAIGELEVALPPAYAPATLPQLFEKAELSRREKADHLIIRSPDDYLDAAAPSVAVAADAIWDEASGATMHGAVAWRMRLAGWRGPYALDVLGWDDRARRHFEGWAKQQNTKPIAETQPARVDSDNLARHEPALHTNGDLSGNHYDMNLVFIDALFRHLLWTGDVEFARSMWPVIERHLAWEKRLFRREFGPEKLPLYEAYAAIWASDDLAYNGGGTTHTSAYNAYHNRFAARLAKLLGKDPTPYEREAELIEKAMRSQLWLPRLGWYAEWRDTIGLGAVHPAAALWTYYHTVDCEVTTPFEAWQMARQVETQLARIPIQGKGIPEGAYVLPTSNWMPYTWSTNNVVVAENAHAALAYWQAGHREEAYRVLSGTLLDTMFTGTTPGNVGMTTLADKARGEIMRDFGDGIGSTARAIVEGLYGIKPDLLAKKVRWAPGFPDSWKKTEFEHQRFRISYLREGDTEYYSLAHRKETPLALELVIPARGLKVEAVKAPKGKLKWELMPDSIGGPRLRITADEARITQDVSVQWSGPAPEHAMVPSLLTSGEAFEVSLPGKGLRVFDPQGTLGSAKLNGTKLSATAIGELGHRTAFVEVSAGDLRWWEPITFEIRPALEVVSLAAQQPGALRFCVRNNSAAAITGEADITTPAGSTRIDVSLPARGGEGLLNVPSTGLPGTVPVSVKLPGGATIAGHVTNWREPVAPGAKLETVDLSALFNDRIHRIFENAYLEPRPPGVSLSLARNGFGSWCKPMKTFAVDDSGLRTAATGGVYTTPFGVPFKTPSEKDAPNILFTSVWKNFPTEAKVPLHGRARHAYLLMAGSTDSMKSRFDNGEVVVTYQDGTTAKLPLSNPVNWWPIDQDYLIDNGAFARPEPVPPRLDLKTGTTRVLNPEDLAKGGIVEGGAATVLDLPLDPTKELSSLTVRTIANEVIIGLAAVTLVRSEN